MYRAGGDTRISTAGVSASVARTSLHSRRRGRVNKNATATDATVAIPPLGHFLLRWLGVTRTSEPPVPLAVTGSRAVQHYRY